ncbi:MAG: cell division protein ZapA [Pseudomonadota bacterium]
MSRVSVSIGGHTYTIACAEGEEARLIALGAELDKTVTALKGKIGEIGDRRLAVMAGLTVLDRLETAEANNAKLRDKIRSLERAREAAALAAETDDDGLVDKIVRATAEVERLTALLNDGTRAAREPLADKGPVPVAVVDPEPAYAKLDIVPKPER